MNTRVELTCNDGIAEVSLNRPEKLNAIDFQTFDEIIAAGSALETTPGIRAVVLSGKGRSFSVGIDLKSLSDKDSGGLSNLAHRSHGDANLFQRCALQWRDLPVPVIAAIQGHALGGGMQLALGADIRIVSPDSKLSIREIAWGLVPDMAGTVLLRRILRSDLMRDLLFSGRIISGDEAVEIGLATRLESDPLSAARHLAAQFAATSPHAMRAAKRLINAADAGHSEAKLLVLEAEEQEILLSSENHREALAAHAEQRAPSFRD